MTRPLKVGVQLPEVEYEPRWRDLAEMARIAEDIGLDSIWACDHYLYRDEAGTRGLWDAWTQLAGIAATTSRIELGPLVASATFHAPAVLAKMASTVDEISGGRLILGLGAGWNEAEYTAFGLPFDNRVSRFEEALTIIRVLLRDGHVDFEGRYYQVRDCELLPRGPRPEGPPLMVGSIGPRMLRIAMPHVQAWNAWFWWYDNQPGGIAALRKRVDEACRDVGRDPSEVERTAAVFVQLAGAVGSRDFGAGQAPPVLGEPAVIAEVLRRMAAEGIGHVQLIIDPATPRGVEQLAPVLEALDAGRSEG